MPQVLLFIAAGAGLLLIRRWLHHAQRRVEKDLHAAQDAMERRDIEHAVPLERDPATGVYRPKHTR